MNRTSRLILTGILALASAATAATRSAVSYVDPFIGTGGHGHTYPGATTPFGAVQLSPDTRTGDWDACGGYYYADNTIQGFSHTHLSGTGCADLGDILFHPATYVGEPGNLYSPSPFSHSRETAEPGYYCVTLNDGIKAELTASRYCGVHRYTYPKNSNPMLVIDMTWTLGEESMKNIMMKQISENEIVGMRNTDGWVTNQHIYFVAQFSTKITDFKAYDDKRLVSLDKIKGKNIQAVLTFSSPEVVVKVGVSTVNLTEARRNLEADIEEEDFDFDAVRKRASQKWEKALSAISIDGGNDAQKTVFYTALYHSMVVPNLTSDASGRYRAHNDRVRNLATGRKEFSTMSFWDTFRAWNPLMTIIDAPLVSNIINSCLNSYEADGELPIWPLSSGETGCMIGYHSAAVIAEAYLKGIRDFDTEKALEAMIATANTSRKGLNYYVANGFIPQNSKRESVSCLLEYAYDDWAIAQYAKAIGHNDVYDEYIRRSQQYINVFDGSTRFFRGKRSDGNWQQPFDCFEVGHAYTEATAWQYRFFVPHDVNGMVQLFGGKEPFTAALDSLYTAQSNKPINQSDITGLIGQYAHGNEPSHHISYLYSFTGEPWKTQEHNLYVLNNLYTAAPDGLCGNEDCGQMSAWYLLSSLGFYPVCPASCQYVLTTPLFERATINLTGDNTLTVIGGDPKKTPYIKRVTLNGTDINTTYITHEQLMQGGTLQFYLSDKPTDWGTGADAAPYSYTQGKAVSVPYVKDDLNLFDGQIKAAIATATPGATIRYTTNGSEPTEKSALYNEPITLVSTTTLKAKAFKQGYQPSATMSITATKAVYAPAIKLTKEQRAALQHGICYTYHEGPFLKVADINTVPVDSGIMAEPSIANPRQPDHFAYVFNGLINIPETGIYTFATTSDDGSVLLVDGKMVVDNDESHSAVQATGLVALQKGMHRITVKYFDDYEGEEFSWAWQTPKDHNLSTIPADRLYCIPKKQQ